MVIVLLVVLCLTAFAGLKTLGAHGKGPLANSEHGFAVRAYADGSDAGTEQRGNSGNDHDRPGIDTEKAHFWKEVHETLVGLLIFLVVVHICGVIASSYIHKENLILSMVTGKKVIQNK